MKRFVTLILIFGWFFVVRAPHPDGHGIKIMMLVGPFGTKQACEADLASTLDTLGAIPGLEYQACRERTET